MSNRAVQKFILALIIFAAGIATRAPLVDRYYQYSFVPDSEAGINISRSFYFFFKNPSLENAPQTLSSYPTYLAGDYICAAITANIIRGCVKKNLYDLKLSDSNDSLIIFSMRWNGVLFVSLSAVILFLLLAMLTGNHLLSAVVVVMYYLFSDRIISIGLMRVDNYMLLTAYALMYVMVRIYRQPDSAMNFIAGGFIAAMATTTKINFPFYLLIVPAVIIALLFEKKLRFRYMLFMLLTYCAGIVFFFQRWFIYPERVAETISGILETGEDWVGFWGIRPFFYFHWHQFFPEGVNGWLLPFVLLFYASLIFVLYKAVKEKNRLMIILIVVFFIQSVILISLPKVSRYGIILPLWISLFITLALHELLKHKLKPFVVAMVAAVLLLPKFIYGINDYAERAQYHQDRHQSILKTRIAAAEWIDEHGHTGCNILMYAPRVSNPPVFEKPYAVDEIKFPFLDDEAFLKYYPPTIDALDRQYDFFVVSDKEKLFHLSTLSLAELEHGIDTPGTASRLWQGFYDSLDNVFDKEVFESNVLNYGVKRYEIYKLSPVTIDDTMPVPEVTLVYAQVVNDKEVELCWEMTEMNNSFQIQLSEDSNFQWLLHGSYDGFDSKYRAFTNESNTKYIPPAIVEAINTGTFEKLTGITPGYTADINIFFANALMMMRQDSVDFKTCMKEFVKIEEEQVALLEAFEKILAADIAEADYKEYLALTGLPENLSKQNSWQTKVRIHIDSARKVYWRVRHKEQEWVKSEWSKTGSFYMP